MHFGDEAEYLNYDAFNTELRITEDPEDPDCLLIRVDEGPTFNLHKDDALPLAIWLLHQHSER